MSPPLVSRSTGDIIPASDHNDVKSYIEDGTYRVKTSYLLSEPGSAPSAAAGIIYFDSGAVKFKGCEDGANFVNLVSASSAGYQACYVVKSGGSVGTNCTHTSIASALTDVAAGTVRRVFVKAGIYDEALTMTSSAYSGIVLEGESMESTIIRRDSGTAMMLIISTAGGGPTNGNILIRNLTFNSTVNSGGGNTNSNMLNLNLNGASNILQNIHFENVSFYHNGPHATDLYSSGPYAIMCYLSSVTVYLKGLRFSGCQFFNTGETKGFMMIHADDDTIKLEDVKIIDCYFNGNTRDIDPASTSLLNLDRALINVECLNSASPIVKNLVIANNTIIANCTGTYGSAIFLHSNNTGSVLNANIAGNNILSAGATTTYGIVLYKQGGTLDGVTITGNTIRSTTSDQIINSGATNLIDSGNNKLT